MRFAKTYVLTFLSLLLAFPVFAQQPSTPITESSPQALALLQRSLAALTGGQSITDVTLTGTARRIAGSDDESGTGVLKALTAGQARMDLSLPSGSRSEVVASANNCLAGRWTGPDGVSHSIAFHNLLTEQSWFFPALAIAFRLSDPSYVATYVGQETQNGQAVQHVSVSQTAPFPNPPGGATFEHLTQVDFYIDSTSFFPVAIAYNTHPDNDAILDIPVEIRFSDYRSVNGVQIPFHVQRFLNNSLFLDFQCETASLNSGMKASMFSLE